METTLDNVHHMFLLLSQLKFLTGFSELLDGLALAGGPATLDACLAKDTQVRQWGFSADSSVLFQGQVQTEVAHLDFGWALLVRRSHL